MTATEYTDNFERAWSAYPKRNGRKVGKKPAFNQWKKMNAEERRAAFADIEKRNRQQLWGKYIRDMQRYLRDAGWQDEIEPTQKDMLGNRPMPKANVPEVQLTWQERMLNRLGLAYIRTAFGLRDTKALIKIKTQLMRDEVPAFQEDIDAATDDIRKRAAIGEAAHTLASLFLSRLDHAYGLNHQHGILRMAKKGDDE